MSRYGACVGEGNYYVEIGIVLVTVIFRFFSKNFHLRKIVILIFDYNNMIKMR